jgi:hypothetical protein
VKDLLAAVAAVEDVVAVVGGGSAGSAWHRIAAGEKGVGG